MRLGIRLRPFAFACGFLVFPLAICSGQTPAPLCRPSVSGRTVVATAAERDSAAKKAQPPLTDIFAWPDTPLGIVKTNGGYEFFRERWRVSHATKLGGGALSAMTSPVQLSGPWVLWDKPLGDGDPLDISVSSNGDPAVNPNYSSYGYMGGGPVYQVPASFGGAGPPAGHLSRRAARGCVVRRFRGWLPLLTEERIGLILAKLSGLNQSYAMGLDGFEIGDGPLVLSPDGKYFYLYFPDWLANGSLHTTNLAGASTTTNVSVARAPVASVLAAAFGAGPNLPNDSQNQSPANSSGSTDEAVKIPGKPFVGAHTVSFEKFYEGKWDLQPAISGHQRT